MNDFSTKANDLIEAGHVLYQMGMVPATSGNFSARLDNGDIAITVSGAHKGKLRETDIMVVDGDGVPRDDRRPSAETGLHVQIYKHFADAGIVLHPHAMNAVLLSRDNRDCISLNNYELLKAFPGIDSHESTVEIPIFSNDQNIPRMVKEIEKYLAKQPDIIAYIIAGHGFYTWGKNLGDALRHIEALDYLLTCELKSDRRNN